VAIYATHNAEAGRAFRPVASLRGAGSQPDRASLAIDERLSDLFGPAILNLRYCCQGPSSQEANMRTLLVASLLTLSASNTVAAHYCEGGQLAVPPAVAARMALPLCGVAATQPWGPNGRQLCDPRNVYPNPFAAPATLRPALIRLPAKALSDY
jgi:hypothetical protein